jgi:hypothetical protein
MEKTTAIVSLHLGLIKIPQNLSITSHILATMLSLMESLKDIMQRHAHANHVMKLAKSRK